MSAGAPARGGGGGGGGKREGRREKNLRGFEAEMRTITICIGDLFLGEVCTRHAENTVAVVPGVS